MLPGHSLSSPHPLSTYSHPSRFLLASIIGTIAFLLSYEIIYYIIDGDNATYGGALTWLMTYLMSIWLQHELNQKLVFFDSPTTHNAQNDYWVQLGRTYLIYTGSMILSTLLNMMLLTLGLGPRSAMVMTLLVTGFGNYFLLNKFMMK